MRKTLLSLVAKMNGNKYRKYYVPKYRSFMYLNLSISLNFRKLLGFYDREKMAMLARILKPGMVFADVGASLGDFTFFAAQRVGAKGKVLAFEPEPENCAWIKKGILCNGYAHVELFPIALSNHDGEAILHLGALSGWHTLKPGLPARERGAISVPTRKLDSLGLERLDFLKIDVEAAEYEVISGAGETIQRFRPLIMIDFHPQFGVDVESLENLLSSLGYKRRREYQHCMNLFGPP